MARIRTRPRPVWRNELVLRRRSPRISVLDQQQDKTDGDGSDFPEKKKGTHLLLNGEKSIGESSSGIKRERQEEGIESQNWKEHSSTNDENTVTEAKEKEALDNGLPDKHLLELVLDVLQRRDTHEIFAEPVDPEEVKDYYEIVKEPMDFGTMRAKLHEGMYNALEEFEHDAFLIPRNALQFNSSGSVYFRQARAIDDLAKKVFHVLKTNPKKLESEFSGIRRRASRRLKIDLPSRVVKNVPSRDTTDIFSSKGAHYDSSDHSKSMKGNLHLSWKSVGTRGSEFYTGAKDGRRYDDVEVDRRSTYKSSGSFDGEHGNIVSTMPGATEILNLVNQGDLSYGESLMKFAEGLGPVAQMVAKRKLQQCTSLHQTPETLRAPIDLIPQCTSLHQTPETLRTPINLNGIDVGTKSYSAYENGKKNITYNIFGGDQVFNRPISKPYGAESLNLSGNGNGFRRGFSNLRPTTEPNLPAPPVSPFPFSLSFLKSKLNQMERPSGNQAGSSSGEMNMNMTSFGYTQSSSLARDNQQKRFLIKSLGGDLSLKL